jgi:hypothetical protein
MFAIVEKINTFTPAGAIATSTESTIFECADLGETMRRRYARAKDGCHVSLSNRRSVTLFTEHAGNRIGFAEMFQILEGQGAFDRVLSGDQPAANESEYVAAMAARRCRSVPVPARTSPTPTRAPSNKERPNQ